MNRRINAERRPEGTGAASGDLAGRLIDPHDSRIHLGVPVLVVTLPKSRLDRSGIASLIQGATTAASPGRHVRLVVGKHYPPIWIHEFIRSDLRVQVEASDEGALVAWLEALGGHL